MIISEADQITLMKVSAFTDRVIRELKQPPSQVFSLAN